MTTDWDHLLNARHINAVLNSLEVQPRKWAAAWVATRDLEWGPAMEIAQGRVEIALTRNIWTAANNAASNIARGAEMEAAWSGAWKAASLAILALIAYDDCAYLLETTLNELRVIIALSSVANPAAILLLPAVIAMQKELATV